MKISATDSLPVAFALERRAGTPELSEAVGEFEAYLVGEMLRMATRSSAGPTALDGGEAGVMYRELLYAELGRAAAEGGALGLAASLEGLAPNDQEDGTE